MDDYFDGIYGNNENTLPEDTMRIVAGVFHTKETDDIKDIQLLKKGMTNRSYLFSVNNDRYIVRVPGEGTDRLINREQEATVFKTIQGLSICDDPVYIDPTTGYKITKYLSDVRVCDPYSFSDLEKCMKKLKDFHSMRLKVAHSFDLFGQIDFYESLWQGKPSIYNDYCSVKRKVFTLKSYVNAQKKDLCLTHIDAVPDNFLFYKRNEGEEELQLTDWEYAGMQDPHVDIAMFCIYSLYDKNWIDRLIDIYFEGGCDRGTRKKIYCYIAICGLLWSNWCEFKRHLGVEFGEYSLYQYQYAKQYYEYALEE